MNDQPEQADETEADAPQPGDDAEGEGEGESQSKGRFGGFGLKKILLLVLAPLVVLGGGGYFAATYLGVLGETDTVRAKATPVVYYDLPEMVVNLSANDTRSQYLKIKVALEAKDQATIDGLEPFMPRILDMFQVYLRELRSTDLEGSAGIFRLKEELLRRVNLAIHPSQVDRILFKEIIVQ